MKAGTNYSNQRVGIFVDVSNLYHSAKNLYQGRVNYAELIKHLVGGRQLIRAMAYVVRSEGVEPQQARGHGQPRMAEKDQAAAVSLAPGSPPCGERRKWNGDGANGGMSSEASFFEALEKAGLELRMKDLADLCGRNEEGRLGCRADGRRHPHDAVPRCDHLGDGRRGLYPARQLRKMGRRASGRDRLVPKERVVKASGGGGRVREY